MFKDLIRRTEYLPPNNLHCSTRYRNVCHNAQKREMTQNDNNHESKKRTTRKKNCVFVVHRCGIYECVKSGVETLFFLSSHFRWIIAQLYEWREHIRILNTHKTTETLLIQVYVFILFSIAEWTSDSNQVEKKLPWNRQSGIFKRISPFLEFWFFWTGKHCTETVNWFYEWT